MKLAIGKETAAAEKRVAASPETVRKLTALGFDVCVERGAGLTAAVTDDMFAQAGAKIAEGSDVYKDADVVLRVRNPLASEISAMKSGALLLAQLAPYQEKDTLKALAAQGVTAFAMEFVPRITRAQTMDVLSSQANLAGYRAVLEAAAAFGRAFPMMMTAAGTVPPAKVFVMGAGVAGLQAIATARRLGATVSATDVRPAAKEQVQSLGASFVMVENEETKAAETSGGYAKEMSDDYKRQQAELIAETIKKQDVVITTALIPGRPAPKLVTEEMVRSMKPGAVIVDLAVEQGGNCALSKAGEIVDVNGVTIVGHLNLPSRIAVDASALYARNLLNFLTPLVDKETKALKLNREDDIVKASMVTDGGQIVHPQLQG
ncbi:MAG TPA: Re/Si-specific NAD(P)(+) transhydrogenase subunit alpha [Alphaproteobacteria bacterium]|nr:Re/Si-specific NAD(P)(+) transhydrogenase subunit alpha [Rhodospirillaceae bacterium]HRJ66583.1 Re/Si-specific NAD(P)(+) transhydrogenase subunit alpha [Alphaproteobacteria bacterium]